MLFYNKHFYVLEGEMTLFLKSTLLIDENISKIVNDAVSEYNKFYNITLPEDTLVIHILDKTTFKKFCVAKPDFVVGFVMQGKVYICEHESIKDRYDEIENQDLSSREVDEFTNQTIDMLKVADEAFKNILNNLMLGLPTSDLTMFASYSGGGKSSYIMNNIVIYVLK